MLVQRIDPNEDDVQDAWITDEGYSVESRNSVEQPNLWRVVIAVPRRHFNYIQLCRLWDDRLKPDQIVRIREQDQITRQVRAKQGTVIEWQMQNNGVDPPWDWITWTAKRASLDLSIYQRYHDTPPPFPPCQAPGESNQVHIPLPWWIVGNARVHLPEQPVVIPYQGIRRFEEQRPLPEHRAESSLGDNLLEQGRAEWHAARNGRVGVSGASDFFRQLQVPPPTASRFQPMSATPFEPSANTRHSRAGEHLPLLYFRNLNVPPPAAPGDGAAVYGFNLQPESSQPSGSAAPPDSGALVVPFNLDPRTYEPSSDHRSSRIDSSRLQLYPEVIPQLPRPSEPYIQPHGRGDASRTDQVPTLNLNIEDRMRGASQRGRERLVALQATLGDQQQLSRDDAMLLDMMESDDDDPDLAQSWPFDGRMEEDRVRAESQRLRRVVAIHAARATAAESDELPPSPPALVRQSGGELPRHPALVAFLSSIRGQVAPLD
jgi:hypothetical protein